MSDMIPTDEMKEVVAAGPVSIEGISLEESEEECLMSLKSGFLSFLTWVRAQFRPDPGVLVGSEFITYEWSGSESGSSLNIKIQNPTYFT